MKMRKILSFVLVLSLVLGSFSMAFAATPATAGLSDIAGNANEMAIQVNNDLGIITGFPDGTFLPEKAVTRAEFAAMITRALAVPESALAGYSATSFKDMSGYGWATGYIGFCASKGIMLGDGQGNAMPGRTINVNEAMTMVLRAIGYVNNSADLVGTWPANYVTVAQNVGLYDDVAATMTVDRASAAQIIYNALTVDKVVVNADGETTIVKGDNKNLLTANLNCEATTGQTITNDMYSVTKMNITPIMGAYGTKYQQKSGDKKVVAFEVESTKLKGKVSLESGKYYFTADKVKYNLNATNAAFGITNTDENVGVKNLTTYANTDTDVTINVDLSGKSIDEVYSAVYWTVSDADFASASDIADIADAELFGKDFVTDKNNDVDHSQFQLVGVASLDKIAKDDVVYVYADGSTIRKVAVSNATVTGEVTELVDPNTFVINGVKYDLAGTPGSESAMPDLGDELKLYLDFDGDVYDYDVLSSEASLYGVMTAYTSGSAFSDAKASIYTSDDATIKPEFIDLADVAYTTSAAFTTNAGIAAANTALLVGYGFDEDGKIDALNYKTYITSSGVSVQSNKVFKDGGSYFDIATDVVVFTYDSATNAAVAATANFDVSTIASVEKGGLNGYVQYILDKDAKKVVAMLVAVENTEATSDDVYGVVNTVTTVKNGDDKVQKIVALIDGAEVTMLGVKKLGAVNADTIGLYTFTKNADGNVKATPFNHDKTSVAGFTTEKITRGGVDANGTVITLDSGKKFTIEDDAVVYKVITKNGNTAVDNFAPAKLNDLREGYTVWLFDTKTGDDHDNIATVVIYAEDWAVPVAPVVSVSGSTSMAATTAAVNLTYSASVTAQTGVSYTYAWSVADTLTANATISGAVNGASVVVAVPATSNGSTNDTGTITLTLVVTGSKNGFATSTTTVTTTINVL